MIKTKVAFLKTLRLVLFKLKAMVTLPKNASLECWV